MNTDKHYQQGLALVTASAVVWSTTGLFTRAITLDSWTTLAWRGLYGGVAILILMILLSRRPVHSQLLSMGWPGWLFAVISAAGMLCFINAFYYTTVAHVAIIYATVPFVAAALGWLFLREPPSASAICSSITALCGVVIMVGGGNGGGWFGDLLALAMTLCLAMMMTLIRCYPTVPIMPAACLSALLSGLVSMPMADTTMPGGRNMLLLLLFGVVNSALGLSLFTLGSRLLPAIETALIGALDAPLAPLWVWLLYNETPDQATLTGGAIVFCAVIAHVLLQARSSRPITDTIQTDTATKPKHPGDYR